MLVLNQYHWSTIFIQCVLLSNLFIPICKYLKYSYSSIHERIYVNLVKWIYLPPIVLICNIHLTTYTNEQYGTLFWIVDYIRSNLIMHLILSFCFIEFANSLFWFFNSLVISHPKMPTNIISKKFTRSQMHI